MTDSQSVIRALQSGPLAQTSDTEDRIWALLLQLANLGVHVTFQFVYAHCGIDRNEAVDAAAKDAVENAPLTPDLTPVWLTDLSRRLPPARRYGAIRPLRYPRDKGRNDAHGGWRSCSSKGAWRGTPDTPRQRRHGIRADLSFRKRTRSELRGRHVACLIWTKMEEA